MRKTRLALSFSLVMCLSACGSGGSGPVSTPAPAPTPTPSPTPAPTPSPTPSPTPTPISGTPSGHQSVITFQSGAVTQQFIGANAGIAFDATSNTYTVTYNPNVGGPAGTGDPSVTRSLTYAPGNVTSTSGNFTTFQHADPANASQTDTLRVSKLGATNTAIALTYTSFAIQDVGDGTNFLQRNYIVFGSPLASVPTTGTASYSGIVDGTYNRAAAGQTYLISGTSTLTADFAAGTVGTTLNFTGNNVVAGQPGLSAQSFSGAGTMMSSPNSQFQGTLTGMGLSGTVVFAGNFYGPNAEEFGYGFLYAGANDRFNGVAVGKK